MSVLSVILTCSVDLIVHFSFKGPWLDSFGHIISSSKTTGQLRLFMDKEFQLCVGTITEKGRLGWRLSDR